MAKRHGSDLRKGRTSTPGQIYLISTVTHQRQPVFSDFHCARIVIDTLRYSQLRCGIDSLTFVVMPDHLHWLFSLGKSTSLSQVVADMKRRSSYRINEHIKRSGTPVWQPGFHDYALRKEDEIKDVARYIVANPLRAGLVDKIGDYPFWDAVWL
jgi:putative transposase